MPWITLPEPKYPLTESEKKWLGGRKAPPYPFYTCRHCEHVDPTWNEWTGYCDSYKCPLDAEYYVEDYSDSAEFEAWVAALLAREGETYFFMHVVGNGAPKPALRLKYARLAVEAEMESGRTE